MDFKVDSLRLSGIRFLLWRFHRNMEKRVEGISVKNLPKIFKMLSQRSFFHLEILYAMALEKLADYRVPADLNYVRTLIAEMERIAFHLYTLSAIMKIAGDRRTEYQLLREYEKIERLLNEFLSDSKEVSYIIPGGINYPFKMGFLENALVTFEEVEKKTDEIRERILNNHIICTRLMCVGEIQLDIAEDFGLTGVNLRASGGDFDLRRQFPYLVYNRLHFLKNPDNAQFGDVFTRMEMRFLEISQSFNLIKQVTNELFIDRIQSALSNIKPLKTEKREVSVFVEAPNGLMGIFLKVSPDEKVERFHLVSPSMKLLPVLESICTQMSFNDLRLTYSSLGVSELEARR